MAAAAAEIGAGLPSIGVGGLPATAGSEIWFTEARFEIAGPACLTSAWFGDGGISNGGAAFGPATRSRAWTEGIINVVSTTQYAAVKV